MWLTTTFSGIKRFINPNSECSMSTGGTKSKQGNEQMRTFEPTNESADCWPATHSYNFIIRVKLMQHIKSILVGWEETNELCLSFNKVSWRQSDRKLAF